MHSGSVLKYNWRQRKEKIQKLLTETFCTWHVRYSVYSTLSFWVLKLYGKQTNQYGIMFKVGKLFHSDKIHAGINKS